MDDKLKTILTRVQKPGRYTGGEPGCVYKSLDAAPLRFVFCFPDTYEVAMSHGWQALDKVGRHLLSPALGTGWANSGLTTEWNCELDVASAAREASDSQIRVST